MINDDADVTCMPLVGDELWLVARCTFAFEQLSSTLATVVSEGDDFCGGERLEDGSGRGDAGAGVVGDGSGSVNSEDGVVGVEEAVATPDEHFSLRASIHGQQVIE